MKNTNNFFYFLMMHVSFLIYCSYTLLGKFASRYEILSLNFILCYCAVFFILGLYAVLWQQVLKHISLTTAIANKSITIVWGLIAGSILFSEKITANKITGTILILSGIILLSTENNKIPRSKEKVLRREEEE